MSLINEKSIYEINKAWIDRTDESDVSVLGVYYYQIMRNW